MKNISIAAGKGGTGKTMVAVSLANALSKKGYNTGVIDSDIQGSNVHKLFGIEKKMELDEDKKLKPVEVNDNLKMMGMGLFKDSKGVALNSQERKQWVRDCYHDSKWGDIDYFIFDTPASSNSEFITMHKIVDGFDGVALVLNDNKSSIEDGEGIIELAQFNKIPIIGIVGNMVGTETGCGAPAVCPECGQEFEPFGNGSNLESLARDKDLDYLGEVPLSERVMQRDQRNEIPLKPTNPMIAHMVEKVK